MDKYKDIFKEWDKNAEEALSTGLEEEYQKEEDKANESYR